MKKQKKLTDHEIELRKNPINVFKCCDKEIPAKEFQKHLTDDHKLTKEQMVGKKSLLAHIDGSYWYSYSYKWEFESGLKFTQYIEAARSHDDPMRFND